MVNESIMTSAWAAVAAAAELLPHVMGARGNAVIIIMSNGSQKA